MSELTSAGRPKVGIVGFGALGESFASGLRAGGVADVAVFARPRLDPAAAAALSRRLAAAQVRVSASLRDVATDADIVLAAVPAAAAAEVAGGIASAGLRPGSLYVDPAPLAPARKQQLAARLEAVGAQYVDVAVLGTVAVDGHRVQMLAAGPGAGRWARTVTPMGFRVSVIEGAPGRASLVKLIRSVYMKGRDALILEMLIAARRHGVEEAVLGSIGGAAEQVGFPDLAERVMRSLALYAQRRSAELESSAELVQEAGVQPLLTCAGAARLRWLAELGLRETFGAERPDDMAAVLEAIDRLDPAVSVDAGAAAPSGRVT